MLLRLYRAILGLMPRAYRDRYGDESAADLERLLADARASGPSEAGVAFRAVVDLLKRLPVEWWAVRRAARHDRWEDIRERRLGGREKMMNLMGELRLAARTLRKKPGFTAVVATTLGLGIGANVAVFSIVDAVLLQPLPYEGSDRIVQMRHHAPGLGFPDLENSAGMLAYYDESLDVYEATAAFNQGWTNLTGGDEAARVREVAMSPEIFAVLRVQPLLGRPFVEADAQPEGPRVALLEHGAWTTRFGADPSIVGQSIELDGNPLEVVGVMPPGFTFPDDEAEIYTPLFVDPDGPFGTFGLAAVSRLAPGISVEVAEQRSSESLARLAEFFPDLGDTFLEQAGFAVTVRTLRDRMVVDVQAILWIVLGTVGFVLLIACANVANLFLVRAESRRKEMAVRAAMGAGRRSVATSFLSESLLLGVGGGAVGVILATLSIPALLSLGELPRASEVSVGGTSLAVAALLSVVVGLVFGSLPLARYAGGRFAAVLRDGARGSTTGRERNRARNVLVATQLALALVLLVGSGLMLRSFAQLRAVDLGIDGDDVLTVALNRNAGEDPEISARFFAEAADRLAALPGVSSVGIATSIPLAGGNNNGGSFYIDGKPREEGVLPPTAMYRAVGGDYFASFDLPVLRGRTMERADWEEARAVVWVNETFQRLHLDGEAIGKRIAWDTDEDEGGNASADTRWAEVVGVVADVREFGLADEDLRPNAYFPLRPGGGASLEINSAYLTIEAAGSQSPSSLVAGVLNEIRAVDGRVPISATRTMNDVVAEEMESTSATLIILAAATFMALFLGAIGLAGVVSYVVGQRTREIGVRVALGATAANVRQMILRQSMTVTVVGSLLGLAGALGLSRLLESVLYEVSATDPLTFIVAPVVLVLVSLMATWLPVRRATRVAPTEALRSE